MPRIHGVRERMVERRIERAHERIDAAQRRVDAILESTQRMAVVAMQAYLTATTAAPARGRPPAPLPLATAFPTANPWWRRLLLWLRAQRHPLRQLRP